MPVQFVTLKEGETAYTQTREWDKIEAGIFQKIIEITAFWSL